jgi:hypothetical protein
VSDSYSPVMGPQAPRLRTAPVRSAISDPAEPWEIAVPAKDHHIVNQMLHGRPFRPTTPAEVPEAASAALAYACGPLPLERLYIIPRASRLVSQHSCVITPASVLGFGENVVGLWIDDGAAGRLVAIPVERLLAIDNRTILLYGRLRLLTADGQLSVHYNTVSRSEIDQNLAQLRTRIAVAGRPVEPGFLWLERGYPAKAPAELPHKWFVVLQNPMVRPDPAQPVAIAAGGLEEAHPGRTRPASGVAILGDRELVIASEPLDRSGQARYGVDLLAVPRSCLDSLAWDGQSLIVRLREDGAGDSTANVTLPLDPFLAEAMWCVFGDQVRWT